MLLLFLFHSVISMLILLRTVTEFFVDTQKNKTVQQERVAIIVIVSALYFSYVMFPHT